MAQPRRPIAGQPNRAGVARPVGGGAKGFEDVVVGASDIPILENWETLPDGRVKGAVYGQF